MKDGQGDYDGKWKQPWSNFPKICFMIEENICKKSIRKWTQQGDLYGPIVRDWPVTLSFGTEFK